MSHREGQARFSVGSAAGNGADTVAMPRPTLRTDPHDSGGSVRESARRHVALVEGSTPHLSAETRDLLRNR